MIKILKKCQVANTNDLKEVINLGDIVLVNKFQKNKKKPLK